MNIFNYPAYTWADSCFISWLVDAGAIVNQMANAKGSYGPYCRALARITIEEAFHLKFGHHCVIHLATGTPTQRKMMQEAINRWWKPMLQFFGPPDRISAHTDILMKWKVKMLSNDGCRQQWLDMYVPKIWELGLTVPDDKLRKNPETGKWEYSEPDWDEFKNLKTNKDRKNEYGSNHRPVVQNCG